MVNNKEYMGVGGHDNLRPAPRSSPVRGGCK